jgi:hypothetical protein
MQYVDAVKIMRPGDIVAVSHQQWDSLSDLESQVVRIMTESEFSHVCVVSEIKEGVPFVLEAVVPRVTINPLTKYLDQGFYYIPTADKPMTKAEEEYGMSKVGDEYSKWEAVGGYFDLIKIGGDDLWMCAELTIAMRNMSGLSLGTHATPAAVVKQALDKGYSMHFIKET